MEQALLVEADAVLASSVGGAIVARAANLRLLVYDVGHMASCPRTFLLRQYLHAMAVRCRGAGAGGAAG
jgi:hypothetical protein